MRGALRGVCTLRQEVWGDTPQLLSSSPSPCQEVGDRGGEGALFEEVNDGHSVS